MDAASIARLRMRAQRLWGSRFDDPRGALQWLTAVQSQEHPYARWSLAQRTNHADAAAVDRAFDEGRILRTHVLRPTWHYVAPQDLRWLIRLSGPRVNASNAFRYRQLGLDAKTLARSNDVIARAVASGPLTRRELAEALERKRIATDGQRIAHMVMRAELDAVICSGPMKGKQHTYAAFDERVDGVDMPRDDALAELVRRYFTARGPATLRDFVWWSGLTMTDAKGGLETVKSSLTKMDVDDRAYWFAGRAAVSRATAPRVDLVQTYDETIISYSQTRDVLKTASAGFPVPRAVDGFAHVLLLDGQLLGHWRPSRQPKSDVIETRIARKLSGAERKALGVAIDRYRRFLGMRGSGRAAVS